MVTFVAHYRLLSWYLLPVWKMSYQPPFPLIFPSTNIFIDSFSSGIFLYSNSPPTLLLPSPASPPPAVSPAAPCIALLQQPPDYWAESSLIFSFVKYLKAHVFQWHCPTPSPSSKHTLHCIVLSPGTFFMLLGYHPVPCNECLRCFLMENNIKNVNCEMPWTVDWESLNHFLLKNIFKNRSILKTAAAAINSNRKNQKKLKPLTYFLTEIMSF